MMKKIISLLLCLAVALPLGGCSAFGNRQERYTATLYDLFDTVSTVVAYDDSRAQFDAHLEAFRSQLEEYHRLYDIYNEYEGITNLCTLNRLAKDAPVRVDEKIISLLSFGKEVYALSGGKTNICFGAVLSLWHSAREKAEAQPEQASLPPMAQLRAAAAHTSIESLVIDKENSTVYFSDEKMQLDVGAIAKGYAVREVCRWAEETLWQAAAISVGGNICTFGYKNNDGRTLWNIEIENPDATKTGALETLRITDLSVVTSGDYQRFLTVDGKRYCHIINPETLMPSEYVTSVSVVCDDSALGDALSTTLFNLPIEEGQQLIENTEGAEAVWVDKEHRKTYSTGFQRSIKG